jgi:ABC-2 type transport system permease protein
MTAGHALRRTRSQAEWETRLLLRNGEQLLLTIIIPVVLLLVLGLTDVLPQATGPEPLATSLATVLAVSVISSAFTSLAIATGFERRSGALRLLSTTPLRPVELLTGKALATVSVMLVSTAVVLVVAVVLGWRPTAGTAWLVLLLPLGVAAWAPWGLVLAGALRAEAVLAVANGAFLAFLLFGGVVIPASALPGGLATVVSLIPSGALVDALTSALADGRLDLTSAAILLGWSALGVLAAARTFRWT